MKLVSSRRESWAIACIQACLYADDHRLTATCDAGRAPRKVDHDPDRHTDFPALESDPIDKLAIDTIRTLCMDAVQAANSGHPGTPMALAPVIYTVWQKFLRFDPDHPIWSNRDRFVLSAGHASTLLYSMLHLAGVKSVNPQYEILGELAVPLEDLKKFRQLDSKCPDIRNTAGLRDRVHHRSAGHGHRDECWHGDGQPVASGDLQPTWL